METVSRDGVSLAYERDGPADAETVVLVEGLGYGRWMWNWQREALADDYDLVLPDNRGTGDSDAPDGPYTIPEMALTSTPPWKMRASSPHTSSARAWAG